LFELEPNIQNSIKAADIQVYAKGFAEFVDSVIQMLGPDLDFIEAILSNIGTRYRRMGGSSSVFPFVGQAIMYSMTKALKRDLTREEQNAFTETYEAVSEEIQKSVAKLAFEENRR
jgi:hemoglobin-like flavoprotein